MENAIKWLRKLYNRAIHSIAFFPALIVFGFLNALAGLLACQVDHSIPAVYCDKSSLTRIITKAWVFDELFSFSVLPIWDYVRRDRTVQSALLRQLQQLQQRDVATGMAFFLKAS